MITRTVGSKITFTPKGNIFFEENFLRYLDLCYVPQIKDLPSIIGCEPIRGFKKLFSQNLPLLGLRVFCCRWDIK